ncbi:hypothetical protein G9A89_004400 [Geosiphon pyriformis]|nr:hypothetical protein G9A89_004400 [Geosiphon pyriformis]
MARFIAKTDGTIEVFSIMEYRIKRFIAKTDGHIKFFYETKKVFSIDIERENLFSNFQTESKNLWRNKEEVEYEMQYLDFLFVNLIKYYNSQMDKGNTKKVRGLINWQNEFSQEDENLNIDNLTTCTNIYAPNFAFLASEFYRYGRKPELDRDLRAFQAAVERNDKSYAWLAVNESFKEYDGKNAF